MLWFKSYIRIKYLPSFWQHESKRFLSITFRFVGIQKWTTTVSTEPNVPRIFSLRIITIGRSRYEGFTPRQILKTTFFFEVFSIEFRQTNFSYCRSCCFWRFTRFYVSRFWRKSRQPTVCHVLTKRNHFVQNWLKSQTTKEHHETEKLFIFNWKLEEFI